MSKRTLNTLTPTTLLKLYEVIDEVIKGDSEDSENTFIHVLEEDIKDVYEAKTNETVGEGMRTYHVLKPAM